MTGHGTGTAFPSDAEFLRAFGARVRSERARRGMSRKLLAAHAGISERYVTQLESGRGNVSLLVLRQVAAALGIQPTHLLEADDPAGEMTMLRQLLSRLSPEQLRNARESLSARLDGEVDAARAGRIALIGLRGAGKTTLGRRLADATGLEFHELDRTIESLSGTSLGSLIELYGQQVYRRYELQALTSLIESRKHFVVATGGGLVSESATYELLLRHCFTVWVATTPEEHMARVVAQGDHRPMAGSDQAMHDLKRILEERTPLYSRAHARLDTSGRTEDESLQELLKLVPADRSRVAAP